MKNSLAAALAAALALPAAAGSFDASGTGTGSSETVVHQMADGQMILHSTTTYEAFEMADPENPLAGMTGTCFGAVELRPPAAQGQGNCVFTGEGGGMTFNRWVATGMTADGALTGTWVMLGGTGAYAGMSGGGTFHSATDSETGRFTNTLTGALAMP